MRKLGLQLFTVRESLGKDVAGTLRDVAAAGYAGVELFGPYGSMVFNQYRPLLAELNVGVISGHVLIDTISDAALLEKTVTEYAKMGAKHLALAWLQPELRGGLEAYRKVAKLVNNAGQVAKAHGLQFAYHNHDFEFEKVDDGRTAHQVLMDETDPDLVKAELDLFWVAKAGLDVIEVLNNLKGRVSLVHVKDMTGDGQRTFEIVGDGIMDFDKILPAADAAGADWFIVEQDQCPQGEIASIRKSYKNIVQRGWN
ncbi:MAG: sugar phosphate isomerase/epimerase [Anaerolineae bacterium]|nr:sugar phosphate isomerase/epimerase [Anaerolineae bacterium]